MTAKGRYRDMANVHMVNKAALLLENRKIEIGDSPMPEMLPGYAKVKVEYCGVCGSDVHF